MRLSKNRLMILRHVARERCPWRAIGKERGKKNEQERMLEREKKSLLGVYNVLPETQRGITLSLYVKGKVGPFLKGRGWQKLE